MSLLEEIKKKLLDQATSSSDVVEVERVVAILRSAAEVEKCELDMEKLRLEAANTARTARSEAMRFWIPVLAPTVGAIILAGTLVLQIIQFNENSRLQNENSRLQRDANEDIQFRETIKTIQSPSMLSGLSGVPLLKSFLASPRYQSQAREVAIGVLPGTQKLDLFKSLLDAVMVGTDWTNVSDIVRVNVALESEYVFLDEKIKYLEKHPGTSIAMPGMSSSSVPGVPPSGPPGMTQQMERFDVSQVKEMLDGVGAREHLTAVALAQFLKKPRPPELKQIDLGGAYLWDVDLSGVDLKNALLSDTTFLRSNLRDVDLSNVSLFEASSWSETAWWRAKAISPQLLKYLDANYKFDSKTSYSDDQTKSYQEYQGEVKRLEALE